MRYYERHEFVYQQFGDKGCRSWDEFLGQATGFESFCAKPFIEHALAYTRYFDRRPTALEIGCGTGPICCFLAECGFEVQGIDVSPSAITIAQQQAQQRELEITFRVADVCRDAITPQQFDVVVDGHCLHCIVSETDRLFALKNVSQALRSRGQFWVETMIAGRAADFGADRILDDAGILWVKSSTPGKFDLEQQVDGKTYVASRRVHNDRYQLEMELQSAGFDIAWSRIMREDKNDPNDTFQAICTVK